MACPEGGVREAGAEEAGAEEATGAGARPGGLRSGDWLVPREPILAGFLFPYKKGRGEETEDGEGGEGAA